MALIKSLANNYSIHYNDGCVELLKKTKEIARIQKGGTIIGPNECDVAYMKKLIYYWEIINEF